MSNNTVQLFGPWTRGEGHEDDADQDTESLPAAAPGGPAVGAPGSSGSWNLGKRFVKEKSLLELSKRVTDSPWYVEEVINALGQLSLGYCERVSTQKPERSLR